MKVPCPALRCDQMVTPWNQLVTMTRKDFIRIGGREEVSWARSMGSLWRRPPHRPRLPASPHPFLLVLPVARVAGGGRPARRAPEVLLVDAVPEGVGDATDDGAPVESA